MSEQEVHAVIRALILTAPTFVFVGFCLYAMCGGFKGLKKRGPTMMGKDVGE